MTAPDAIIILKREPGPVAGTTLVTIDAPRLTQAQFVVDTKLENTAAEQAVLAQMLKVRADALEAAKEGQI